MNDQYLKIRNSKNYYITAEGYVFKKYGDYNFKFVKPFIHPDTGYYLVTITMSDGKQANRTIHRLVADAFLKKPKDVKKKEINHINGVKSDNSVENLEYVSHTENMKKGWMNGQFNKVSEAVTKKRQSMNGQRSELTETDVKQIRSLRSEGLTNKEVAFIFDLHPNQISRIFNRRSFADVI
jgi:hypothetical protein